MGSHDMDETLSKEYIEDLPRIDTAVRNFLTMQITENHFFSGVKAKTVRSSFAQLKSTIEGEKSEEAEAGEELAKENDNEEPPLGADKLMRVCGCILRHCNSVTMANPVEYFKGIPQEESQTGLERIEEIAAYKTKYNLWKHIKQINEEGDQTFRA